MDLAIVICTFVGSWLLVAGAIYQAALELTEQEMDREEIASATSSVQRPARDSAWWWLLPPVAYVRQIRRSRGHRLAILNALGTKQLRQTVTFFNKTNGWLTVAGGAFLLAVSATWDLRDTFDWPVALFWVLLVVGMIVSIGTTVRRMIQTQRMLARAEGQEGTSE